jgi:large subunit ribosomal protein L4
MTKKMVKASPVDAKNKVNMINTLSAQEVGVVAPEKEVSPVAFSIWIRALIQNWRQGTVTVKGRSDVAFSNKKPWKQKGTGRARAGSARSPLWRKGGVCFGPQPRVRTLKVTKKLKDSVLHTMVFNQLEAGKVAFLDWAPEGDRPRTALAFAALKEAQLIHGLVTVFVANDDAMTYGSFANIRNVRVLLYDQANAYDFAHSEHWVVLKKDLEHFKGMVGRWI